MALELGSGAGRDRWGNEAGRSVGVEFGDVDVGAAVVLEDHGHWTSPVGGSAPQVVWTDREFGLSLRDSEDAERRTIPRGTLGT